MVLLLISYLLKRPFIAFVKDLILLLFIFLQNSSPAEEFIQEQCKMIKRRLRRRRRQRAQPA
jgi:hypothetical protein